MSIIDNLAQKYFSEEMFRTTFIIILICILSLLKINVISYLTANIIKSIQVNNIKYVYEYFKYFIIVSVIYVGLYIVYKFIQNKILNKLRFWIKIELMNSIFKTNNEDLNNVNFTKLNIPIQRISTLLFFLYNNFISILIPNLSISFVVFCYFFYKNIILGLIFLLGNIIIILYSYYSINSMVKEHEICEDKIYNNESIITEILNNIDKIIYRGYYKNEINIFAKDSDEVMNSHDEYYNKIVKHTLIINVIIFGFIFILIYWIIQMFIKKQIDITIFITFFTIILLYRDTIVISTSQIPDYIDFKGRYNHLNTILDNVTKDYKKSDNNLKKTHILFNNIKFENVSFKYKKTDKNIFDNLNLNLDVKDNNIIGITGISGKGKSTIAKLLIKLYKYNGNIYIDGIDIKKLDTNYIRQNIIYVNQNSKLFDRKIIENIFYGCENNEQSKDFFNEAMKFPNIKKLFNKLNLYNVNVGFSGENLSGGQRQVINIINGLINPAKIIILDEPTNSLDIDLKNDIIQLIKHYKKYKKCVIIISHDKDIYPIFDNVIEMKNV